MKLSTVRDLCKKSHITLVLLQLAYPTQHMSSRFIHIVYVSELPSFERLKSNCHHVFIRSPTHGSSFWCYHMALLFGFLFPNGLLLGATILPGTSIFLFLLKQETWLAGRWFLSRDLNNNHPIPETHFLSRWGPRLVNFGGTNFPRWRAVDFLCQASGHVSLFIHVLASFSWALRIRRGLLSRDPSRQASPVGGVPMGVDRELWAEWVSLWPLEFEDLGWPLFVHTGPGYIPALARLQAWGSWRLNLNVKFPSHGPLALSWTAI
jgi:hypothetical protein